MWRGVLIGCGRMGANTAGTVSSQLPAGYLPINHADALLETGRIQLVACCDIDEDRAKAVAARYQLTPYTDYREMLITERPNLAAIATRTEGRCEMIAFAAAHGVRAIHAEKPLGRSLLECQTALDAVNATGVALTYGATRRFMDIYRKAKQLVQEGYIGHLQEVQVAFEHSPLLWYHPHSLDLLLFFSECTAVDYVQATCQIPPESVTGHLIDADPKVDVALVQFQNGIRGLITGASGFHTILSGTLGNLIITSSGSWIDVIRKDNESIFQLETERIYVESTMGGTVRAFHELADALDSGAAPSIRLEEIRLGQQLLSAIVFSSLQEGRRVSLEEVPSDITITGKTGSLYA